MEEQSLSESKTTGGTVLEVNKSGTLSISRERDAIKSSGTVTDWRPVANVSGTNFRMTVRGETDVIVEWCSNITFTQIKTGVAL